ncbi:MAG: hypothetical protein IPJ32_12445 [Sphingobacteriaceae bacterium]|nr:hypothetical protein [Sphingobacteriaceae bacterium]
MYRLLLSCLLLLVSVKSFTQVDPLFDETKVEITPIKQNTDESEFGPYVSGSSFYYTSSQERKVGVISMEASTLHQMLDLYSGKLTDSINIGKIKPLPNSINTPLNQGGCFFDKATSKLYYSTNIPCEGYSKKLKLAIYSAILQNDQFLSPIAELVLPDTFMAAHPYIYNNKLYFSSNMLGGKGKTDIYCAEKQAEAWGNLSKWGNYKNCDFLNTEENEYFPFVINENEIYFSSNRLGGLGKLDLYKYTSDGINPMIQNAGAPMNSEADDFSIYVDSLQEKGYFASNREDNQDDIYFWRQTWPTFNNCKESVTEDYCYNLSEESTLDKAGVGGFYYEWLFGDGTKQKGLSVRHCFPAPGNYLINLNIIDSLTKSVFMSQATFDLKVDSIIQLKINCLDTVLVDKPFAINTDWTYLPDNKIEGYFFEIGKQRLRGKDIKHSFSKTGNYKIKLGIVTLNTKTNKKELLCTTKNIVCVNQDTWAGVEERKFNEELTKYAYRSFKTDSNNKMNLVSDDDIEMFNKMGLNGKKLVSEIKTMLAATSNKKQIVEEALQPGESKFAFNRLKLDTVMRLREEEDVTFKVHFGTSKTKKDTSYLSSKGIVGIMEEVINNEFHYTYGNEKKINDIEKYYQKSLRAGVKNPVVIGYRNGKIIFDQSANIHPATFEETILNAIKDSILASAPQNYIENKNNEPSINTTSEKTNVDSNTSEKNNTSTEKSENNNSVSTNEKQPTNTSEKSENNTSVTTKKNNTSAKNEAETKTEPVVSTKNTKENNSISEPTSNEKSLNTTSEPESNSMTNLQKKMEYYLQKYGDVNVKDLEFRVQVGAYRKRKSYRFPKLAGLGEIKNEEHPDGITRMTIGGAFSKLSEALGFTKKVIRAGHSDAFVSVYYKGKRVYIENLEKRGVFSQGGETTSNTDAPENNNEQPNYSTTETNSLTDISNFEARTNIQKKIVMYAQKYGNISADGLEFKVQIAVFKYRKNYDFPQLKDLGEINVETLKEGLVRITIGGSFKTLGEAFEHNKKVVIAGQTDAFVSVFLNGKRIYIENLEHKGIFVVNKN